MENNKVGNFIAEMRKKKNLTQQQLGDKLYVTDKAVSKWERGLSLPDVSLYPKICKELDIKLEELINGEKDISDEAKEKAIIASIKETIKTKKQTKKTLYMMICLFVIIVIGIVFYNIEMKVNLTNDSDYLYEEVINYMKDKDFKENPDAEYNDFNTFYSYYGFGIEKDNEYKNVYMWIYNQSYYIEPNENGGELAMSSGSSIPIKAVVKNDKIIEIIYPEDGNRNTTSIKKIFPGIIKNQVLSFDESKNVNKLFNDVENQKNTYYNYLTLDMSKITLDDLDYNDIIFSIEYKRDCDIPVELTVMTNNKYYINTEYKACKEGQNCNSMLVYTNKIEGKYNYDIIEIIKHSTDANNYQYQSESMPEYMIHSGKGHEFITDSNNKYLNEFLNSIDVDLTQCAKPNYD